MSPPRAGDADLLIRLLDESLQPMLVQRGPIEDKFSDEVARPPGEQTTQFFSLVLVDVVVPAVATVDGLPNNDKFSLLFPSTFSLPPEIIVNIPPISVVDLSVCTRSFCLVFMC